MQILKISSLYLLGLDQNTMQLIDLQLLSIYLHFYMGNKHSSQTAKPTPTPPSTGRFQYHIPTSWFLLPRQPTHCL